MSGLIKQMVDTARSEHRAYRRRGVQSSAPASTLQETLAPQRRLAAIVQEVTVSFSDQLSKMGAGQRRLMQGVQEYLGLDDHGVDESAMALVSECACFFESFQALFVNDTSLRDLSQSCEQVMRHCDELSNLVKTRDEAYKEWQHYEDKVAGLLATRGSTADHVSRNREKLAHAKERATLLQGQAEAELRAYDTRRVTHCRATLRTLLKSYVRFFAQAGAAAKAPAEGFEQEFRSGVTAEVVGLQKSAELNGTLVTVAHEDQDGRMLVLFPDGSEKSVRCENLCPLDARPPAAAEAASHGAVNPEPAGANTQAPALRLQPSRAPCSGGSEAEILAEGLVGCIEEVLVGGVACELLETGQGRARVRVPAAACGPARVEVRTAAWRQCLAVNESALEYFSVVSFGPCGRNVELSAREGDSTQVLATRSSGLVDAVTLTSELPRLPTERAECAKYYFEFDVLEVSEKRTNRTLSLGFAWMLPQGILEEQGAGDSSEAAAARPSLKRAASSWVPTGALPESASQLPRSFVVGGDLPKALLGGREVGKVQGWRPLLDVVAGTVLGALLEVDDAILRIKVMQDGRERCCIEGPLPDEWRWPNLVAPNGVVDVCGKITQVALRQGASPPEPLPPSPRSPGAGAEEDEE